MHEMDTILVAVGVPTKEGAGSPFENLHSLVTHKKPDTPEAQSIQPSLSEATETLTPSEESDQTEEFKVCKEEEHQSSTVQENGWNIPDISDLLDSICVSESDPNYGSTDDRFNDTEDNRSPECQCGEEEVDQSDTETESNSWEWDTTHWNNEHTLTHNVKTTQDRVTNGKLSTHKLHSPLTDHTWIQM